MRYPKPAPYTETIRLCEYDTHVLSVVRPLEEEIWAAIRLLAVEGVCMVQLRRRFPTRREGPLTKIASMISSCITQAEEYYRLAVRSSNRVAPLLHYYSMLNLAKALIWLEAPTRLSTANHFHHGLSDPARVKDPQTFSIYRETLQVREGVFPSLHFVLTGQQLARGTSVSLADLLQYCTSITYELEEVAGTPARLIDGTFGGAIDAQGKTVRLIAEMERSSAEGCCRTMSRFKAEAPTFAALFSRVASHDPQTLLYESQPIPYSGVATLRSAIGQLRAKLRTLRLYRFPTQVEISPMADYWLPLSMNGGQPLPEPCVLLAITFYLGSLVRYQPHIYDHMLGSAESWILESFVRQCPLAFCHIMLNHLWRIEHLFVLP